MCFSLWERQVSHLALPRKVLQLHWKGIFVQEITSSNYFFVSKVNPVENVAMFLNFAKYCGGIYVLLLKI